MNHPIMVPRHAHTPLLGVEIALENPTSIWGGFLKWGACPSHHGCQKLKKWSNDNWMIRKRPYDLGTILFFSILRKPYPFIDKGTHVSMNMFLVGGFNLPL